MPCEKCEPLEAATNLQAIHVIRVCQFCGDDFHVLELGEDGFGFQVRQGDRVVVPAGAISLAVNPLKGSGQFSREGISWFAQQIFVGDIAKRENIENFADTIERIQEVSEDAFIHLPELEGLDLSKEEEQLEAFSRIDKNPKTVAWWQSVATAFFCEARDAIAKGDASRAAWSMAAGERLRALSAFKEHFEEVVFMGNSARKLLDLLKIWDANQQNDSEGFWQKVLENHAYAISQMFSAPVTFIRGRTYVGGMSIDGSDARYLDFILSGGNSNRALMVEIKTPCTKLIGTKYRKNVYAPSKDLSGSVVQVNDYCNILRQNIDSITNDRDLEIDAFDPKRIILMGNYAKEIQGTNKQSSFELFRSSLSGVEILTFDEFFRKVEELAKLFNLTRKQSDAE